MHVLNATAAQRRASAVVLAIVLASLIALIVALGEPAPASAVPTVPACTLTNPAAEPNCLFGVTGTHSYNVSLTAAAQNATGIPGDGTARGSSSITLNADTNTACATTSWSGNSSPVVWAHIHQAVAGQPENPAVAIELFPFTPLGVSSPASGCTLVPPGEIGAIVDCPSFFAVVVHEQKFPAGAIRGQLAPPSPCAIPL